ncbi:Uncharacterised protein [Klebsiella pneumoniae]|nr:hypothetical protein AD94_05139 [Klebsiella variicola]SVW24908.1 Uncharacterised protein [Klebsiella pneumoniae]SWN38887.1 Uncharacterised protein [Klebsiella pneumoniae]
MRMMLSQSVRKMLNILSEHKALALFRSHLQFKIYKLVFTYY